MPPLACPRCQRTNPADAAFCFFDGALLRAGAGPAAAHQLPREFSFPSGRRCRTFDELAVGCQEEWAAARELLRQGAFRQFFTAIGRMDLARSAQEAMAQSTADIGLTQLIGSLPTTAAAAGPKLDLSPRRLMLGSVFAGETRQVQLTITNQGRGMLQGTVAVTEGGDWLRLGAGNGQQAVQTAREQRVAVQVDTRGLAAGQSYGGKLTVITNGGVVEVPARVDLTAHPFTRPPFQGVRTQREMAERMRTNPKLAVGLLESGELPRWFASNGWKYPVAGAAAKGVAGVQQFFEALGLAKPPDVQLSQTDLRFACKDGQKMRAQLMLRTPAKKWVYGNVSSDSPWLRVLTPAVTGPQQAAIAVEVDPRQLSGRKAEATLRVVANAGQTLTARVRVQAETAVAGGRPRRRGGVLSAVCALALALGLLRLLLAFPADFHARQTATSGSAAQTANRILSELPPDSAARGFAGWLRLPWFRLLVRGDAALPDSLLGEPLRPETPRQFRDNFVARFLRTFVGWTWWLGLVLWPLVLLRRGGGLRDLPWGVVAGAVMGVLVSASLGCLVLVLDLMPQLVWEVTLRSSASPLLLPVWILLAVLYWAGLGGLAAMLLYLLGPWGQVVLAPVQQAVSGLCRRCGLRGLAEYTAPA